MEKDISRNVPISLYYQLKEELLKRIISKQWLPGEKIPTEKELCSLYGVSRITVRKALDELERSGHLVRRQGKGTFVTNISFEQRLSKFYSFSEELKQRGLEEHSQVIHFDQIPATSEVANHLGLEPQGQVFKLTRLRLVDLTPYTLETSYIPVAACPSLTEKIISDKGLYNSMRVDGVFPDRVIEKFSATVIRKSEAELMELKIGMPAMHLERVTYFGVRTIEYCISIVRGDFFTYTVELI
jgi:GntR family transcriptional regulator